LRDIEDRDIAKMQIKHFFIATSIALPAIAAPLPNHNTSKPYIHNTHPTVPPSY
jgi:hypothetical protein